MHHITNARTLRTHQTDAERMMWFALRDRRFLNLKFRRQHPIPPYILDFYCPVLKLAIELDGGQHNTDAGIIHDRHREAILRQHCIQIVRFWNNDVLQNMEGVLTGLKHIIDQLNPHPTPLPHVGEGDN